MKVFCSLLLLATLFCISPTNARLTAFMRQQPPPPRPPPDYQHLASCAAAATKEECTGGLAQEAANVALKCNQTEEAQIISDSCRKNAYGTYCGLAGFVLPMISRNFSIQCRSAMQGQCSQDCKNFLNFVRSELGCCINAMLNSTTDPFPFLAPFRYAVWRRCSIPTVTDECSASSVKLSTTVQKTNCSADQLAQQIMTGVTCKKSYIQPVLDALDQKGNCDMVKQAISDSCGVNKAGKYCTSMQSSTTDEVTTLKQTCNNPNGCTQECTQGLLKFQNELGCCMNNLYNSTLAGVSAPRLNFLSYQSYMQCGLTSPGRCPPKYL